MTVSTISSELSILLRPKFSLMVHYPQPKCPDPVKRLDNCVQDEGQSKGSKFQWMIVQTVSPELASALKPDFV